MTTVTRSIRFVTKGRHKRAVVATPRDGGKTTPVARVDDTVAPNANDGRVPRVARLMALAIRFDQLLRDGVVANQTELARLARVTQPRMTQIMNLLHLAPTIQEEVLFLRITERGRDQVGERDLRPLVREKRWPRQLSAWRRILDRRRVEVVVTQEPSS